MNLSWRVSPNFHWWIVLGLWAEHEFLPCVWKRENKGPAGQLVRPNPQSFHQNTEPHTLYLHQFIPHLLRLWFQIRIKDLFRTDQYWRWRVREPGLLYQAFYDWVLNDMLMGFSPHTVCSERFMRLPVVLYRICVSVLWERCNELMLEICRLLWVFSFSFQALLLTFSGTLSVVELLCIPGEIISTTLAASFDLTTRMTCYYFWGGSLNYLHLYMSNNCTEGTEHLEDIMFKWMGTDNKDKEVLFLKVT